LNLEQKNSRKICFEIRIKIRKSNHERGIAQHRAAHTTVSQEIKRGYLSAAGRFAHQHVQFSRNFGLKSERLFCLTIFVIYLIYFYFIFENTHFNGTKGSY